MLQNKKLIKSLAISGVILTILMVLLTSVRMFSGFNQQADAGSSTVGLQHSQTSNQASAQAISQITSRAIRTVSPTNAVVTGTTTGVVGTSSTFNVTVGSGTTPMTYTWSATDLADIVNSNINSLSNSASFTWSTGGTKTVTVVVSNATGSTSDTLQITIPVVPEPTNQPPQVSSPLPNIAVAFGAPNQTLNLSSHFSDPEGLALDFTVIGNSNRDVVPSVLVGSTAASHTLQFGAAGQTTITIEARDSENQTVQASFTVTVGEGPTPTPSPTASPIASPTPSPTPSPTAEPPADGNGDGTPDNEQPHVDSVGFGSNGEYMTTQALLGEIIVNLVSSAQGPAEGPPGATFGRGFFRWLINSLNSTGATRINIFFHLSSRSNVPNTYWMYGPTPDNTTPHWYNFAYDGTTGAEFDGEKITLHFVDGQRGDSDLSVNGQIEVPDGGPATYQTPTALTLNSMEVQSSTPWQAGALAALLTVSGLFFALRRKKE